MLKTKFQDRIEMKKVSILMTPSSSVENGVDNLPIVLVISDSKKRWDFLGG